MNLVDVEAMGRAFLLPVVAPVPVVTLVPAERPSQFVRLSRTGGAAVNRALERAQLTVEGWAADTEGALELASKCRHAFLNDALGMPLVRSVSEVGGLHFTADPSTGLPRYRFTVELIVRAAR